MRIARFLVTATILAATWAALPARAECSILFKGFQIDVPGVATFYYEDRSSLPPVPGAITGDGTWIYMESNEVPGLQRSERMPILEDSGLDLGPIGYNTCFDDRAGDTMVFGSGYLTSTFHRDLMSAR